MFNSKRGLLWWRKSEREEAEEGFDQGFHGIPSPHERAKMSPEKLAILLSQQQSDTPAYILVEHELNLRIASVQSQATLRSGWLGLLGALLGAALGFFLGTLSPEVKQEHPEQVCRCECGSTVQNPVAIPKPPASFSTRRVQ
ncbi:MAG: hypothetical protein WAW10_04190 [Gallionella sp.]